MSFEDYIKAVIDYYMQGGTTWDASYWRVLVKNKPLLADKIVADDQNPTTPYVNLGDFLHIVYTNWGK